MSFGKSLQSAIDYMESHLLEKINYENVAKEVHMSCYNFHRIFSLMAGITANEYIRNRKLSLAGQELQLTDSKIIDVAFKYGYETPESFAKAFSRFHGVSPKLAKRKGTQLCLFNPLAIKIILEGVTLRIIELKKQANKDLLQRCEHLIMKLFLKFLIILSLNLEILVCIEMG
ncbi:helix-turn-helix transcriptional regulator [Clostridium beijerinckii]|uniref:AraC-like DNA-binding protein n=1 Tax=Clostridium beijerinckii TaxID=1520 RepID=A0A9Q5CQ80_CLOBE|nr:AraC family transcriptional regulator [Clostridium beijerinckii]AQS05560.1 regulatory protein SoxS [Clostridium beijerinckii]MBA2884933.1 AraC-like DNA-binding protein [Clostridium beijerinckii]MBA2899693.1 AraC-like DNA-binding protein [Clostridium beijerinckii]MBA2909284.1 AraC-like DNA-binding protein [Clostridium beijerinckii]MBA9014857.1 AraC-like DNA-binding protein [Clostridium beijerinckii]